MSKERPKTPRRTTENPARGRKGRGSSVDPDRLTRHRCGLCGKRRPDGWGKVPRAKYGEDGGYAHPQCKHEREVAV